MYFISHIIVLFLIQKALNRFRSIKSTKQKKHRIQVIISGVIE